MNRTILNQQINKDLVEKLKWPKLFFLKVKIDGVIIHVLEKLGRLENSYGKEPLLILVNHPTKISGH